ncbi:unnamed protein product, partial [Pocillopora meandrina]
MFIVSYKSELPIGVTAYQADFKGLKAVNLTLQNPYTLIGLYPRSEIEREVTVEIIKFIENVGYEPFGKDFKFTYKDEMSELAKKVKACETTRNAVVEGVCKALEGASAGSDNLNAFRLPEADCASFASSYREEARKGNTLKHSADQYTSAQVSRCKSMASSLKFTEEQLNYLKICLIVADELTGGLREIFKREWDNRYKTTLGEWKDEPKNGMDFWNGESCRNRRRYAALWKTMKTGKRAEWDCTMLFYAILYSDCIHSLNPVVRSNV